MFGRARDSSTAAWRAMAVTAAVSAVLIVGGSPLSAVYGPGTRALDAVAYVLLTAAAVSVGLALLWPVAALILALGATSVFYSLGYSHVSPVFVSVLAILFIGATAHRVRRSVLIGFLAIAAVLAQHLIADGLAGLNTALLANIGWITSAVLAGHALAAQRDYMAAMRDRALRAEETRELEAERRVTEERLRIARELHDVVSHTISLINVQAGVAAHVIEQRPEQAVTALETIRDASKEALREIRGILNVLRQVDEGDETSPAPGLADLGGLVQATSQAGLQVTFITGGQPRQLSATIELAAYRIVQESLTNALRYAHGGSAEVKLVIESGCLTINIDNTAGTGTELIAGSGQGIVGMRERATAVGGTLEAGPRADGGFRVCAILPLQP